VGLVAESTSENLKVPVLGRDMPSCPLNAEGVTGQAGEAQDLLGVRQLLQAGLQVAEGHRRGDVLDALSVGAAHRKAPPTR
tara:strand:- start:418 stop:660 length:243 start_codon:yes stop_codon:yes gene_type:complete